MALSSLSDIISRACDELSVSRPSSVVNATDPQVRTLLSHAQGAGRALLRVHQWGALQTLGTVTTADGTSDYDLPADFDRLIGDTFWDHTNQWMMVGPDTPQINRYLNESGVAQTSTRRRFRLKGTTVTIWPTPTDVATLHYEYVSNKWALSSGDVAQTEFLADTDTSIFDPDLLKAEIKWRFRAGKGLYAADLKKEADDLREQKIAADLGGTKLSMSPDPTAQFIELDNIADSGWSLD